MKLGMTLNEHIVLKNICKHKQINREHHTLKNTLDVVKTYAQDLI